MPKKKKSRPNKPAPWKDDVLKIQLLKTLKGPLEKRFNPANAEMNAEMHPIQKKITVYGKTAITHYWIIDNPCPLCERYLEFDCMGCPFFKFSFLIIGGCSGLAPCLNWIWHILFDIRDAFEMIDLMSPKRIMWTQYHDKRVRQILNTIRKRAEYLIEWVDEYDEPKPMFAEDNNEQF